MKPTLGIGLLLMAASAWAQEPAKTSAIIEIKNADVNRLGALLQGMFGGNIKWDSSLHVIVVSGTPDMVTAVSGAVQKLDTPAPVEPDVELTVYLISGLVQGQGSEDVPPELASTVKQLHGLFAYKTYKLSDTVVLRGRAIPRGTNPFNGLETKTEGVLPGSSANLRYQLAYNSVNVSSGTARTVHINALRFSLKGPSVTTTNKENVTTDLTQTPANILTDLDVQEGQKTVVGKSSVNSAGDALILVVVPKVVD